MDNQIVRSSSFGLYLAQEEEFDLMAIMLADKRSPETQRAYRHDLEYFFKVTTGASPTPQLIGDFLLLSRTSAIALVLKYKADLMQRGLKEATINRRLASIKALVRLAQKLGKCNWSLEEISGEKVKNYRDTTGTDKEGMQKILAIPDVRTLSGIRDKSILLLLWTNALRRSEVVNCNCSDFSAEACTLAILGKGKGTQKTIVSLSKMTVEIISQWLNRRPSYKSEDPLFIALDNCSYGKRLTGQAIYNLVRKTSSLAGIEKIMSPHRCRHSSITQALEATNGDVRRVQKFSRHSKLETLMLYDDNRTNHQGEITEILDALLEK